MPTSKAAIGTDFLCLAAESPAIPVAQLATDRITAEAFQLPGDFLPHVATLIVNEVNGINRVTYNYTPRPPRTTECR